MKVYGALEAAQIEWFTNAGKPAASSYPFRVIYVTDLKQIQVSDGTNWNPSALYTYTAGTLPAAGASNQYQVAFITDTLQVKVSDGSQWKTIGARLDTYTSGTIPAAASNTNSIIWVSDLQQVQVSNGTAWVQVGSKAGTKNYFSQNNANADFETNSVTPWSVCSVTFSSGAPSGAPTLIPTPSGTQMSIATTATTPLSGTYSMLLTKPASNTQYQGFCSAPLTIDREDTAKVLYGSFYYEVTSGATNVDFSGSSTQSLEIWIYNTVSGQWTQPAGYRGMNQSSGVGRVVFSFQTDGTYANNAYRIAVITQQTSTSSYVVEFDDFQVGPQAIVLGSAMTDWQNFTPTYAGGGSATYNTRYSSWRRNGDTMEIKLGVLITASGSGASNWTIAIPNGLSIDTSKLNSTTGYVDIGSGDRYSASTTSHYSTFVRMLYTTPTTMLIVQNHAGSDINFTGASLALNDQHFINVSLPIQGWGSFSQMSSDTDTRVVAASYRFPSQSVTGSTDIAGIWNKDFDTHAAFTNSTGRYSAPVNGVYRVSFIATKATATNSVFLYKNGSSYTGLFSFAIAGGIISGSTSVFLNAGEYISFQTNGTITIDGQFSVERISGPSVITATETVAAAYWPTANNSTTAANPFNFDGKEYDTHNAVTTGAGWKFTAPVSGKYSVKAFLNPFSTPPSSPYFSIYKNGSFYSSIGWMTATTANCATGTIALNAGDYIDLRPNSNFQMSGNVSRSVLTNCSIQIERIGN